jgi:hypothetical protein
MEEIMRTLGSVILCALIAVTSIANAALIDRGNGLIYDTDLNVTWLQDANLAATNRFGVNRIALIGTMNWEDAGIWISAMNSANYLGFSDWRLPKSLQPDGGCVSQDRGSSFGFGCVGSEMGHLFYNELGGVSGSSIGAQHNANFDLFTNLNNGHYWTGTQFAADPNYTWYFNFGGGNQQREQVIVPSYYAMAVRSGDVAPIPEPSMRELYLVGVLMILAVVSNRRYSIVSVTRSRRSTS